MNSRQLAAYCASRPAAVEDHPWGPSPTVFKVGGLDGPMFAIVSNDADPPQISLKCDPDLAEALRRAHPAVVPGYHLNKRLWNTVTADGSIPDAELRSMVDTRGNRSWPGCRDPDGPPRSNLPLPGRCGSMLWAGYQRWSEMWRTCG